MNWLLLICSIFQHLPFFFTISKYLKDEISLQKPQKNTVIECLTTNQIHNSTHEKNYKLYMLIKIILRYKYFDISIRCMPDQKGLTYNIFFVFERVEKARWHWVTLENKISDKPSWLPPKVPYYMRLVHLRVFYLLGHSSFVYAFFRSSVIATSCVM